MRRVLEREYGEPLDASSTTFDEEPIAAASIGQVYRATPPRRARGRGEGAVPRASPHAVRADLQNLGLILRLAEADRARPRRRRRSPTRSASASTRSSTTSSRRRTSGRSARIYRGHPFIVIPEVVTDLLATRASSSATSSTAAGFEELKQLPDQDERDRVGEIIFRFYFGCDVPPPPVLAATRTPATRCCCDDGRMAFLDFGLFKRISGDAAERELAIQRARRSRAAART